MADQQPTGTGTGIGTGLFSRRPSFFSSKNKGQYKASRSSLSYAQSTANANTTPPTLNLPLAAVPDAPPLLPNQYEEAPKVPTTPPRRRQTSRHSIASSVTDIGSQLRRSRSASLRTNTSAGTASTSSHKRTPSATLALTYSPEKAPHAAANASKPSLSISTFARNRQKSSENVRPEGGQGQIYEKSPLSAVDKPKTPFGMSNPMPLRHPPSQKDFAQAGRQPTTQLAPAAPIPVPTGVNPNVIFQHIHEMASKRISTLDYLRKAYVLARHFVKESLGANTVTATKAASTGSTRSSSPSPTSPASLPPRPATKPAAQHTTSSSASACPPSSTCTPPRPPTTSKRSTPCCSNSNSTRAYTLQMGARRVACQEPGCRKCSGKELVEVGRGEEVVVLRA
jgi:hypothetical protein